jgi:hypothetical protein
MPGNTETRGAGIQSISAVKKGLPRHPRAPKGACRAEPKAPRARASSRSRSLLHMQSRTRLFAVGACASHAISRPQLQPGLHYRHMHMQSM